MASAIDGPAEKSEGLLVAMIQPATVCDASSAGPSQFAGVFGKSVLLGLAKLTTDCAPASSSTVWLPPWVKVGSSLTAVTTMVNVCATERSTPPFAVPPESRTCTVTVAVPLALAAGVKVNVPSLATSGWTEKRALLLLVRTKSAIDCWLAPPESSSDGPASNPVAQPATVLAPLSSKTVWFAPLVKAGWSLTGVTVRTNVSVFPVSSPPLAVPPLSLTTTVTVTTPFRSGLTV